MLTFKQQVHEDTGMRLVDLLPKKAKRMIYRIAHQDKYKAALLMMKHLRKDPDVISRGLSKHQIQNIAADHFGLNHREFAKILNRQTRYEEAPPGMADTVKKFKADGMDDDMAFALAWKIYNKKKNEAEVESITEGVSTEVSTALETVLGTAYESVDANDPQILLDAMADDGQFKKSKKYWEKPYDTDEERLESLQTLGNNIKNSNAPPGSGGFEFQSGGTLSDLWKNAGGSNTTAKADIILGGKQYSVKNADGAQLMSAKGGEATATAVAAAQASGIEGVADNLIESIKLLESVVTKGYYASANNLQRLKQNADKDTTLFQLATALEAERVRYDKEYADYKKSIKGLKKTDSKYIRAKKAWEKNWPPEGVGRVKVNNRFKPKRKGWSKIGTLGKDGRPALGRDHSKVIAKGEQEGDFQTKINIENKAFTDEVDGLFEENAKTVKKQLQKAFKNDKFKKEFCYEAASGKQKFVSGASQTADHMLSWAPDDAGVHKFKVSTYDMKDSNTKIIGLYADQMTLDVNWKSSSVNKHKGYNIYQNVRLSLGKLMEDTDYAHEVLLEEYNELTQSLNEGVINEAGFLDKIKGIARKFVTTIKELAKRILNWFKEAYDKIAEAASEGVVALGNILGLSMDIKTNADKELSI